MKKGNLDRREHGTFDLGLLGYRCGQAIIVWPTLHFVQVCVKATNARIALSDYSPLVLTTGDRQAALRRSPVRSAPPRSSQWSAP
jgi:hypothetical protein